MLVSGFVVCHEVIAVIQSSPIERNETAGNYTWNLMAKLNFEEFAGVTLALFSHRNVFDIELADVAECAGIAKEFEKRGCMVQRLPEGNRLSVMHATLRSR